MKIEFLTKNYSNSDKLKEIIERKIERLDKFFESDTKIKVLLKKANDVETMELTIIIDSAVLRSEVSSESMFKNIDVALPKLEKQIIKHREKLMTKSKKVKFKDLDGTSNKEPVEKKSTVVRSKTYELIPMTVEDAIDELEMVGHSFYVFANKSTKSVNVLYKRVDGEYGLIETVF